MKRDPAESVTRREVHYPPPLSGLGGGKAAWVRFAEDMAESNRTLLEIVDGQSQLICELRAEIKRCREQGAARTDTGGRPRLSDDKVRRIEADLAAGLSRRETARRNRVSPTTVIRLEQRRAEGADGEVGNKREDTTGRGSFSSSETWA